MKIATSINTKTPDTMAEKVIIVALKFPLAETLDVVEVLMRQKFFRHSKYYWDQIFFLFPASGAVGPH